MRRRTVFLLLLGLSVVQLAVPLRMIAKRQATLESGQLFRFRTAPVDPYDAFRGRYVALSMAASTVAVADVEEWRYGQKVFVLLENDDEGFAVPVAIEHQRPQNATYLQARCGSLMHRRPGESDEIRISYPFDRYYMNEEQAPAAERAYRQHSTGAEHNAFVEVRIKDGFAVLEELYVDGVPIGDFLARGE